MACRSIRGYRGRRSAGADHRGTRDRGGDAFRRIGRGARSVENPLKYYHNNTAKSRALIRSAVKGGVRHFIFSSTAATYGVPEVSPVTEDSPKLPINPYGMSKLMTEIMLADTARAHPLNFCALRYFNVAGADPQGAHRPVHRRRDASDQGRGRGGAGQARACGVFGTDFATPDGTGVRDYIHVSDLAEAHVLALGALIEQPERSLTMNCGYGRGFSVLEVLDAVDRVTNRTIVRMEDRRAGDPDR
jgi:UDP-glucose 4-epimerase